MTYRVISLFAGIGGFDLGLERTSGFRTVAFCEIDKKAQAVLRKHWPEVPIYDDVTSLTAEQLRADGVAVDVICGGFPCQDISTAGRGLGLAGERSGLWAHYARLIGELAPRFVIVENVSALLSRGLGDVLGDLAALGYDAEWHCIPASAIGAHHRRDRVWIIAYANSESTRALRSGDAEAHPLPRHGSEVLADTVCKRQSGSRQPVVAGREAPYLHRQAINALAGGLGDIWSSEPALGRVAHGVPGRMDRLKQLGNAVVPQIPELIGRAILAAEAERSEREAA